MGAYATASRVNGNLLGNNNTGEVHALELETAPCRIEEILQAGHGVYFIPDTLDEAHAQGYDSCHFCIDDSTP